MIHFITGGTGSLGYALTHHLLSQGHKCRTISRNEHRIKALEDSVPAELRHNLSCFVGDVRDRDRLMLALRGVDYVIHAAALKGVGRCEYDPGEAFRINVAGTYEVFRASLDCGVKRAVFVSSDKAVEPVNTYGASKALGEKLWIGANRYSAGKGTAFVVVRYGNCWGSNGSVIRVWREKGKVVITDPEATRFHLRLPDAVGFVMAALRDGSAGSIYVPILPSYRLRDLAQAYSPETRHEVIGLQPGEKLHECMVNQYEARYALMEEKRIRINGYLSLPEGMTPVTEYTSGRNTWRLSIEELRAEIAWLNQTRS